MNEAYYGFFIKIMKLLTLCAALTCATHAVTVSSVSVSGVTGATTGGSLTQLFDGDDTTFWSVRGHEEMVFTLTFDQSYDISGLTVLDDFGTIVGNQGIETFSVEFFTGGVTGTSVHTTGTLTSATTNGNEEFYSLGTTVTADSAVWTLIDNTQSVTASSNANTDLTQFREFGFVQVPEPSSAALLGLGGLAFIARRKR